MLTLYFDKEFLDDFWIQYDESENFYIKKLLTIIREFSEMTIFIGVESNTIEFEHPYFDYLLNNNRVVLEQFDKFTTFPSKKTKIAFVRKRIDTINDNSILFIDYDNLIPKLKSIFENCQFKIDLSIANTSVTAQLACLKNFESNKFIVVDKYALRDLRAFTTLLQNAAKDGVSFELTFFTKSLFDDQRFDLETRNSREQIMFISKRRHLNSVFPGRISGIKFVKFFKYRNFDFHDRILISNLFTIDIGIGFAGIHRKSNSLIIVDTILDKFTYKRAKNITNELENYTNWLNNFETGENKIY